MFLQTATKIHTNIICQTPFTGTVEQPANVHCNLTVVATDNENKYIDVVIHADN